MDSNLPYELEKIKAKEIISLICIVQIAQKKNEPCQLWLWLIIKKTDGTIENQNFTFAFRFGILILEAIS